MAKQAEGLVPAKQRVHWVDCTKAIGSLLVIVGHSHLEVEGLRGLIYSFHMPLFFLLSGATFHFLRTVRNSLSERKKRSGI